MNTVLLAGASVRAMAHSALRAGFAPIAIDLFGDLDLQAVCKSVRVIPRNRYPRAFGAVAAEFPGIPCVYGGGLENHPEVVTALAARGPLWGNDAATLARARSVTAWATLPPIEGILWPERAPSPPSFSSSPKRERGREAGWLVKPLRGAAGMGIRPWRGELIAATEYLERRREGTPGSAVYVGANGIAKLAGVSRQLVGVEWCRAPEFAYCGSVCVPGDFDALRPALVRMGNALAAEFSLRGAFGVDFLEHDGMIAPVDLNPRWTASIEAIERAYGLNGFEAHARCFNGGESRSESRETSGGPLDLNSGDFISRGLAKSVAKAILYAVREVTTPRLARDSIAGCDLADLPAPGTLIGVGEPIISVIVEAEVASEREIEGMLRKATLAAEKPIYAS